MVLLILKELELNKHLPDKHLMNLFHHTLMLFPMLLFPMEILTPTPVHPQETTHQDHPLAQLELTEMELQVLSKLEAGLTISQLLMVQVLAPLS